MITTLLWDHDGVLVDTEGLYFQATREVLRSVGAELSEELYRELFLVQARGAWHLATERGVDELGLAALRQARHARYMELLLTTPVLLEGVVPLLSELSRRYRMAIVTSSHRDHFEVIHQTGATGVPSFFELILAREDYRESKPHPEPYLTALARLDVTPEECLVIEDSERGLRAAKAAGLRCWVVPSTLTESFAFEAADAKFASLAELGDALLALPSA